ncbi:hypothetical protein Tsubulata_020868 [Turnera subulata]|uniref:MADS-box domain-containing protein n=1 Tax=Turnera subulata TaxID=218843 RepID=A0A9Q0FCE7_9ROSI|nr:hypothetical protein Tsubulata_020868 [Turnera subulata]
MGIPYAMDCRWTPRIATIKRKAEALSTLCGVDVGLVYYDDHGNLHTWPEDHHALKQTLTRYNALIQQRKQRRNQKKCGQNNKKRRRNTTLDDDDDVKAAAKASSTSAATTPDENDLLAECSSEDGSRFGKTTLNLIDFVGVDRSQLPGSSSYGEPTLKLIDFLGVEGSSQANTRDSSSDVTTQGSTITSQDSCVMLPEEGGGDIVSRGSKLLPWN